MLVLQRKVDQSILIGEEEEIKIKIIRINGAFVTIGIEAPRKIPIIREELKK